MIDMQSYVSQLGKLHKISLKAKSKKLCSLEVINYKLNDLNQFSPRKSSLGSVLDISFKKIYASNVCINENTGLYEVYTLVGPDKVSSHASVSFGLYKVLDERWSEITKFSINIVDSCNLHKSVFLTSGPLIVLIDKHAVYIVNEFGNVRKTSLREYGYESEEIQSCLFCGICDDRLILILCISSGGKSKTGSDAFNRNDSSKICVFDTLIDSPMVSNVDGVAEERCFNHQINVLVPDVYAEIISCISLKNKDVKFCEISVYACTTRCQFVKFRNGKLKDALDIPFSTVQQIVQFDSTKYLFGLSVIHSVEGQIAVVDIEKFNVIYNLNHVSNIVVDDFLTCGSEQVLFIFSDDSSDLENDILSLAKNVTRNNNKINPNEFRYVLTDWAGIFVNSQKISEICQQKPTNAASLEDDLIGESRRAADLALINRLNMGRAELCEIREGIRKKEMFVNEICYNLQRLSVDHSFNVAANNLSLVNLIGAENSEPVKNGLMSEDVDCVTTGEIWQRIQEGRWIVGTQLRNNSEWKISDVVLCLIPDNSHDISHKAVKSYSKCFKHSMASPVCRNEILTVLQDEPANSRDNLNLPPSKRLKLDERILQFVTTDVVSSRGFAEVVSVCDVPEFCHNQKQRLHVVLTWSEIKSDDPLNLRETNNCAKIIGEITLSASDVLNTKYQLLFSSTNMQTNPELNFENTEKHIVSLSHDILALNAIQLSCDVCVTSRYTTIIPALRSVLVDSLHFNYCPLSDLFYCCVTALLAVRVVINGRVNGSSGIAVTFYTKNNLTYNQVSARTLTTILKYTPPQDLLDTAQLSILLHGLYDHLPQDVVIQPSPSSSADLLFKFEEALRREVALTRDAIETSSMSELEKKNVKTFPFEKSAEVQQCPQDFQSRRKRLLERNLDAEENNLMPHDRVELLSDVKLNTDMAALNVLRLVA